jgi:phosphoribosyl-ATP pyrophosphohydrolase
MAKKKARKKAAPKKAKRRTAARAAAPVHMIDRLYATIASRKGADPNTSYTAKLMARGRVKLAQKLGEEAVETLIEAVRGDNKKMVEESADVLYHLLALWATCGVRPERVWRELERREGRSGIEEKASRTRD